MVPPADDLFRLTHCPACGYRLDGLPAEGVCPECGRGYDHSEIVLYGTALGELADVGTASRGRAVVHAVMSGGMALAGLYLLLTHPMLMPGIIILGAGSFFRLIFGVRQRQTSGMPGLIQVRLGARGVWQSRDPSHIPARPRWTAWDRIAQVEFDPRPGDWCQIRARRHFWTLAHNSVPVDAEVRCTSAQLAALRLRIDEWRCARA